MKIALRSLRILCLAALPCLATGAIAADKPAKKGKSSATSKSKAPKAAEPAKTESKESSDTSAAAAPAESQERTSYRAPYGMAGCGLGSVAVKNHSKGPQIGAAFLNYLFGTQTFGISTGSSNCRLGKEDLAYKEQEVFMKINFASLAKDAARGDGEHLSAFAEILGCSDEATFKSTSQKNYSMIFEGHDAEQALGNYRQVIKADNQLAKSCIRA